MTEDRYAPTYQGLMYRIADLESGNAALLAALDTAQDQVIGLEHRLAERGRELDELRATVAKLRGSLGGAK